jgi:hypothetical protein
MNKKRMLPLLAALLDDGGAGRGAYNLGRVERI